MDLPLRLLFSGGLIPTLVARWGRWIAFGPGSSGALQIQPVFIDEFFCEVSAKEAAVIDEPTTGRSYLTFSSQFLACSGHADLICRGGH
jgi:hypothetical protein